MLVCFLCPIRGQHLSGCFPDLIARSSPANSTVRRVPVWLVQDWELSSSRVFSGAPKVYSTNFIWSSCITEEKILTNSQTLKGEKNSFARAWQVCRSRAVLNNPRGEAEIGIAIIMYPWRIILVSAKAWVYIHRVFKFIGANTLFL